MLAKKHRLTKKKDFDAVFKGAKSVKEGFLVAKVLRHNTKESRFGFIVSKKISNKATVRNLVKRRLRKAVEDSIQGVAVGVDIVFITLPGIQKQEFSAVRGNIITIFKKI